MKSAIVVKVAAAAVVVAGLAGCQDLKPLQADIADLKSQVSKLQSDLSAAKSLRRLGGQRRPVGQPGGQRCAEHGEPGPRRGSGQPELL